MSDSQNADIWINWWSQQDAFISLFIIYYIIIIYYSTLASLENLGALKNAFCPFTCEFSEQKLQKIQDVWI